MAPSDVLELARQGDPRVLETVINQALNAHGVFAQVRRQDNSLHLLLKSSTLLSPKKTADVLSRLFQTLGLHSDLTLKVYHRLAGEQAIAWEQELDLQPLSSRIHSPSAPEMQPPEYSNPANQTTERSSVTIQEPLYPENVALAPTSALESSTPYSPNLSKPLFDDDDDATANLLNRPESVVLLVLVSLVLLWEFYLDLIDDTNTNGPLSGRGLARRLGVNSSTISRRKDRIDFDTWAQDLDPDGIAWVYQDGLFMPKSVDG